MLPFYTPERKKPAVNILCVREADSPDRNRGRAVYNSHAGESSGLTNRIGLMNIMFIIPNEPHTIHCNK